MVNAPKISPKAALGADLRRRNQAHINDNPLMPPIVNGKAVFNLESGKYLKTWQGPQHPGITGNMSLELVICGDEIVECFPAARDGLLSRDHVLRAGWRHGEAHHFDSSAKRSE